MPRFLIQQTCCLLLFFMGSFPVWAETDKAQAEALFQEGITLFQQRYSAIAITPLEKAANLGHAEAAYHVGEILRRRYTYITEEAEAYYLQAAEGGEVYAMLRLGQIGNFCGTLRNCDYDRQRWIELAIDTALPRAETGDTDAMMAVGAAYAVAGKPEKDFEWVKRAAENDDAFAQYWMAVMLDEMDRGFYWTENGRREDVLKWLQASAEQGFPKAILKLAVELKEDGRFEEANKWVDHLGKTDYFDALFNYGLIMLNGPDGMFRYPVARPIEGLAMLIALHRQKGSSEVKRAIDEYKDTLDSEVISEAEALSGSLLVDTPILHYLPKFGL